MFFLFLNIVSIVNSTFSIIFFFVKYYTLYRVWFNSLIQTPKLSWHLAIARTLVKISSFVLTDARCSLAFDSKFLKYPVFNTHVDDIERERERERERKERGLSRCVRMRHGETERREREWTIERRGRKGERERDIKIPTLAGSSDGGKARPFEERDTRDKHSLCVLSALSNGR